MTNLLRYWATALFAVLPATAAAAESSSACKPEHAITELSRVTAPVWCGNHTLLYGTRHGMSRSDPVLVWADLDTGETKSIPLDVETQDRKETFAGYTCSPDGKWAFYVVAEKWPGAGRTVAVSLDDRRTVAIPFSLFGLLPSPDGRKLLFRPHGPANAAPVPLEEIPGAPEWDLIPLPRSDDHIDTSISWLPDSRALRVGRIHPGTMRSEEVLFELSRPDDPFTPLIDAPAAEGGPEEGEPVLRDEYSRVLTDRDTGWHRLQWCRLIENRQYCETVARVPVRHETGMIGSYDSWSGERPVMVLKPRPDMVYYVTQYYAGATREGPFPVTTGAVYRYDRTTGWRFRIAEIGMVSARGWTMVDIGASPDGARLVYRPTSEPHTVHVLNLDDPETLQCGTPAGWLKE